MALKAIRKDLRATVTFYIDSQYVADQLRYKFVDWVREDLRVENQDLWDKIFMEVLKHAKLRIKVKWIPGTEERAAGEIKENFYLGSK